MSYTLKQAAEAAGKSKPTILRAIQNGKISAVKDEHDEWRIDPAELHRVYPVVTREMVQNDDLKRYVMPNEIGALRRELEIRDERLATLEAERDRERQTSRETIDDLRRRLDAEAEERRKLTAMLTDQRARENPPEAPQKAQEGRLARAWSILRGRG